MEKKNEKTNIGKKMNEIITDIRRSKTNTSRKLNVSDQEAVTINLFFSVYSLVRENFI